MKHRVPPIRFAALARQICFTDARLRMQCHWRTRLREEVES